MMKQIHKRIVLVVLAALISLTSQGVIAYEVSGESFPANFKITSWTAEDGKSTITSEGVVGEGYGKVYLTHTFNVNSDDGMSGDMVGQARTVNQDGELHIVLKMQKIKQEKLEAPNGSLKHKFILEQEVKLVV